ncbi:MAG TPA: hypothetical protein VNT42_03760 [Sphingomonas sp.]|nr:hypothetical protein [Sphingomonas sp.]
MSILLLAALAAPLAADPPTEPHLFGERIGRDYEDIRTTKRIDNRLPTRLRTRIEPRATLDPLRGAKSTVTVDPNQGCTRGGSGTAPCQPR